VDLEILWRSLFL